MRTGSGEWRVTTSNKRCEPGLVQGRSGATGCRHSKARYPPSMRCGIGLGSNVGDRLGNLRLARKHLLAAPEWLLGADPLDRVLCASIYETEPVGCPPGSSPFLNTVVELPAHPSATPTTILGRLQSIEVEMGRPSRHPRNAPRSIDLDLLYCGDLELSAPELTLPHPRLFQRRFVLAPLAEIRPDLILPGDPRSILELLQSSGDTSAVACVAANW